VIRLFVTKKYRVEEVIGVPKESFIPAPKVESSVLLFQKHGLYSHIDDNNFLSVIKLGFSSNRKKLITNLVA
jgi:16S rRNA A1518/A1519 N6-dimethyltransferase RsmA/KsgA/DIM1 with predicted DNA glycosylase/AP lyase activity